MTKEEFQEIRRIIMGMDNPVVTREFNRIFDASYRENSLGIKGAANKLNQSVEMDIPENVVIAVEKGIAKNSVNLDSIIINGGSLTSFPKLISTFTKIKNDIASGLYKLGLM